MHENNSIGELGFNLDVWKSFTPQQQEAANSAVKDTFITWITRCRSRTPMRWKKWCRSTAAGSCARADILLASLKAWDEVAKENSDKSPTFKKVYESQRAYAAKVVPAKRYMFRRIPSPELLLAQETKPIHDGSNLIKKSLK